MKAIVFAAGIGSRLKPFTDFHPKALAPLAGIPILGRVISKLRDAGADGIIVNIHHFPDQIRRYLADNDNFGVDIEISDESQLLLDTGGALAKIFRESRIVAGMPDDEPIIVHNADIYTDFPIPGLIASLRTNDAAILVDNERDSSRRFLFTDDGRLAGWINLASGLVRPDGLDPARLMPAAFGGVHAMSPPTLRRISDYCGERLHPFGIVDFYIDSCSGLRIAGYQPTGNYRWFDIGTTQKLQQAEASFYRTNDKAAYHLPKIIIIPHNPKVFRKFLQTIDCQLFFTKGLSKSFLKRKIRLKKILKSLHDWV